MTKTPKAKLEANRRFHAKREADGLKKVTLWLSPEARSKLDALKKAAGSKDKAADAAILAWGGPPKSGLAKLSGAARDAPRRTDGGAVPQPKKIVNRLKGEWKAP